MDIGAFCKRIRYTGLLAPNECVLCALHRAFFMSVPFENLDIYLGRRISVDTEAMFRKIVERERGGFCYELNVLFAAALRQIGFDVEMFSARVFDADGKLGREFGHLLVFVQLEDRWIADVGFGDWFAGMCEDLQFGTDSYFRNHRICTRPTAEGRVSVMDDTLIVTKRGARIERPLSGPKELAEVLEEHFGIMLPITSP